MSAQGPDNRIQRLIRENTSPDGLTLNLSWYKVGEAGAQGLAKALPNMRVTTLDLTGNYIGDAGAQALAQVLPDTKVTTLKLRLNDIRKAGAEALAQALPNARVTTLDLNGNKIGAAGAQALAKVLPHTQVKVLNLRWNCIGERGAQALAHALPRTKLITLNLEWNNIRVAGAQALAQALPSSQVTTLDLRGNVIGEAGVHALAQALPRTQLTTLDLRDNGIGEAGNRVIEQALEFNRLKFGMLPRLLESLRNLPDDKMKCLVPSCTRIMEFNSNKAEGLSTAGLCVYVPLGMHEFIKEVDTTGEIIFASGIYANLPSDLRKKVLTYLPSMNEQRASRIIISTQKKYEDKVLELEVSMMRGLYNGFCNLFSNVLSSSSKNQQDTECITNSDEQEQGRQSKRARPGS